MHDDKHLVRACHNERVSASFSHFSVSGYDSTALIRFFQDYKTAKLPRYILLSRALFRPVLDKETWCQLQKGVRLRDAISSHLYFGALFFAAARSPGRACQPFKRQ